MKKKNNYYEMQEKMKSNNLKISYSDVQIYDFKPFELNNQFIKYEHFTCIGLHSENLKISYKYLKEMEEILHPFRRLYKGMKFPNKISTDYMLNRKLSLSHLRLNPYTATMQANKYPMCLWLTYWNDNKGFDYTCTIEFEQDGTIGKCDFRIDNYTFYIKKKEGELYLSKMIKVLREPPFGNKILYDSRSIN